MSIVTLHGEHDLNSKPELVRALEAASQRNVLVDMSRCTFVDSAVVSVVLRVSRKLQERDGVLELVIPSEARPIRRVFELMGLESLVPMRETLTAGIASVESHAAKARVLRLRAISELIDVSLAESELQRRSR